MADQVTLAEFPQPLQNFHVDSPSQDKPNKINIKYTDFWNPVWDRGRLSDERQSCDGAMYSQETSTNFGASFSDCFRCPFKLKDADGGSTGLTMTPSVLSQSCDQGQLSEAIQFVKCLRQQGVCIPSSIFVRLIQRCMEEDSPTEGRAIHNLIIKSGLETDTFLGSYLIRMYVSFKALCEANEVFKKLFKPTVFTWSAIISAHGKLGQEEQAIKLYHQMCRENVTPDGHVFVAVLKSCHGREALEQGKSIHGDIKLAKLESDLLVGSALIDMYSNCGSLADACSVFKRLSAHNIMTWNAIIAGHIENGVYEQAFVLFDTMQQEGIEPHRVTFVCMLKACANMLALEQGRGIHACIIESGFESDRMVGSTLVDMYCKCGCVHEEACLVFDRLPYRNVYVWSALIGGFAQIEFGLEALQCLEQMQEEGVQPNKVTFVHILKACACIADLKQGQQIYSHVIEGGFGSDIYIVSTLIDMFSKCGSTLDACLVFDRSPKHSIVTWNALITGYVHYGCAKDALNLFKHMQHEGLEHNPVTFVSVLKACSTIGALDQGKGIHVLVARAGLELNVFVGNTLIDMYGKLGSLLDAQSVFDKLSNRDIVTWSALIAGYAEHGHCQRVFQLYKEMQCDGVKPNDATFVCIVKACLDLASLDHGQQIHAHIIEGGFESDLSVGNTLVDMYGKFDSVEDALVVFERLPKRDVVSWNAVISGCTRDERDCEEALQIFQNMQLNGIKPDYVTFLCVVKACSSIGALEQGRHLHSHLNNIGLDLDIVIGTTLIGMYSKCGCLEDARRVFDRLHTRDVGAWNALIAEYARHCNYWMAFLMFEDMQQEDIQQNDITFLCVLSACSHVGLQDEGCHYFKSMRDKYRIKPLIEHHNSIVDLFGHVGNLNAAEDLLETIPFQCDSVGWASLLSSCKKHGIVDVGRRSFNQVVAVESRKATAYVLMADIYEHAGMQEDAKKIEELRSCANVWKKPARAFIEIDNQVHSFIVGGKAHLQSSSIYAKIKALNLQMEEEGYKSARAFIDEDREDALCGHSEKLAIAFGLINTPQGSSIRVTKNLRQCADCHLATKFISQIERREIIVADAYCIHHFMDGECSCED